MSRVRPNDDSSQSQLDSSSNARSGCSKKRTAASAQPQVSSVLQKKLSLSRSQGSRMLHSNWGGGDSTSGKRSVSRDIRKLTFPSAASRQTLHESVQCTAHSALSLSLSLYLRLSLQSPPITSPSTERLLTLTPPSYVRVPPIDDNFATTFQTFLPKENNNHHTGRKESLDKPSVISAQRRLLHRDIDSPISLSSE